ncbi:TPA: recombinase family protein [Clostridium botulinum]|uniref:recombinase family protein n=1 Tax=Clostridium botulinum TaxID=1491 RepID=UPI001C9A69EA|nr:recombinase family protein [Clostridium botulinum]MBY6909522.1 recombinase family protein [Clostridium botulinum]
MYKGYARVALLDNFNLKRQISRLRENGCQEIFSEVVSGTSLERPEFKKMIDSLQEGDTVIVTDLARISRSPMDISHINKLITSKGACLVNLDGGVLKWAEN